MTMTFCPLCRNQATKGLRLPDDSSLTLLGDQLMQSTPGYWNFGNGAPHQYEGIPPGGNYVYLDGHAKWRRFADMDQTYSYSGVLNDGTRDYYW